MNIKKWLDKDFIHCSDDIIYEDYINENGKIYVCRDDGRTPHYHFEINNKKGSLSMVEGDNEARYFYHGNYNNYLTEDEKNSLLLYLKGADKFLNIRKAWNSGNPREKINLVKKIPNFNYISNDAFVPVELVLK